MYRDSKLHASPLVTLCKERKEIIEAAKYCRYDFVASFLVYLDSLLELGNSLNQYVDKEFLIFDDSCFQLDFSSFNDTDSDLDSLHCHDVDDDEEEDGQQQKSIHHHHHSVKEDDQSWYTFNHHDTDESMDRKNIMKNRGNRDPKVPLHLFSNNSHYRNFEIPHIHIPGEDFGLNEHNHVIFETQSSSGHWFPQNVNQQRSFVASKYEDYGAKQFPMNSVSAKYDANGTEQNSASTLLPIPPPPQASTWDFLHPLNMNYEVHYNHDHDEREIREREGIPDLEDESEQSSTAPVFNQKEIKNGMKDGTGPSNVAGVNADEDAWSTSGEDFTAWRETTEEEPKTTVEDSESGPMGTTRVPTPVSSCSMSLKEAVLEIKNQFKHLFDCGREFSTVIEAGKQPYHSISSKLEAFACCVMGRIIPSLQTSLYRSYMLHHQPAPRTKMLFKATIGNIQGHVSGDLSSTLEKLCEWEKKLYGEVVCEEKLRIPYDNQHNRLKKLDLKGSEPDKIDEALASIKLLNTKLNVAVASIRVIAKEISELRDDKLLPELNKLIEGLIRLWKVMSTCHQKQFQAISKAKSHVHILDHTTKKKSSSSKSTLKLERVILKWGMSFSNFINTQKTLVKHLNNWLLKCILQETEEAEEGIGPSLPWDLGAPPIFGVCNNWYNAIDKVSETEVSEAISNFALQVHQLYERLKEEKALKNRVKCLLKDYKHKLESFCKKNDISSQNYSSFIKMKASENFVEDDIPLLRVSSDDDLATTRQRLIEQRNRHKEVIKKANDIASSCLQEGLTPIFYALKSFCLENLKIFEQLRLPNTGLHD